MATGQRTAVQRPAGGELAPPMEPPEHHRGRPSAVQPDRYWQAQGLADTIHREFEAAVQQGDRDALRNRFYLLARYYARTLRILRQALASRREALLQAALRNLVALHQPLHHMHDLAPSSAPLVLNLDRGLRRRLVEDLLVEVLEEAEQPLTAGELRARINELHLLADVSDTAVADHVTNLVATGHVAEADGRVRRIQRPYRTVNLDRTSLQAMLGEELYARFEQAGFHGLTDLASRGQAFREFFTALTGFGHASAQLFSAAAQELLGPPAVAPDEHPWHHADLIGSLYPRPYQYDVFALFRGYGYQGVVIEAPTGSGKTLVGMMCIQDWLRGLSPGQSVLVLVPTVNYQQQWLSELCWGQMGLQLPPDCVFTGTPAALEAQRDSSALEPPVLVMTYAALAQAGSPGGKGGFDQNSIERFLQGNGVQYVVLDEVHKVVDDLHSVSAAVTRLLTEWLRDGTLRGLVGFSGTAAAYRQRFAALGLQLVYTLPAADLIAYGFVAPFAEFGVPFAYSAREQELRAQVERYKAGLRRFLDLVGGPQLRQWFAQLPAAQRLAVGRDVLRLYAGRRDRDVALAARLTTWEAGGAVKLTELPLVTLVQLLRGWSDADLVAAATAGASAEVQAAARQQFEQLRGELDQVRAAARRLSHIPDLSRRLALPGFGDELDAEAVLHQPAAPVETVRDALCTTLVGLYEDLRRIYLYAGEGRVDVVRAIVAAERGVRPVTGVIIFDAGKRMRWQGTTAVPGYAGVAGLFGQLLGERGVTPMAVLSGEIYLPWHERHPPTGQIADYVRDTILLGELGPILLQLALQGLALDPGPAAALAHAFETTLRAYAEQLQPVRAGRPAEFEHRVLRRLRRVVRAAGLGRAEARLLARLRRGNPHLDKWVDTFFDYAAIATRFRQVRDLELEQASGERRRFCVVPMAGGDRKQLMYDLAARIVDAEELPVNLIIVSAWARTGWNVIRPNVLVDATATRDVVAWQQLRGRAMRALRSWDADCARLVLRLLGARLSELEATAGLAPDVAAALHEVHASGSTARGLTSEDWATLTAAHQWARDSGTGGEAETGDGDLAHRLSHRRLSRLTRKDRHRLVLDLMLYRNKVTHIYELVKATGSSPQIVRDRGSGGWRRVDAIEAKHRHEYAVHPLTGVYGAGAGHSPLVYSGDPRQDLPAELRRHLRRQLRGRDPAIVRGWFAALTGRAAAAPAVE